MCLRRPGRCATYGGGRAGGCLVGPGRRQQLAPGLNGDGRRVVGLGQHLRLGKSVSKGAGEDEAALAGEGGGQVVGTPRAGVQRYLADGTPVASRRRRRGKGLGILVQALPVKHVWQRAAGGRGLRRTSGQAGAGCDRLGFKAEPLPSFSSTFSLFSTSSSFSLSAAVAPAPALPHQSRRGGASLCRRRGRPCTARTRPRSRCRAATGCTS